MTVIADDADDEDKVADDSVDDDDVDDYELIISCYHANALSVPSRSRFMGTPRNPKGTPQGPLWAPLDPLGPLFVPLGVPTPP